MPTTSAAIEESLATAKPRITDLPDTCLAKIFTHLSLVDLLSVRKSCKHFEPATATCLDDPKWIRMEVTFKDDHSYWVKINNQAADNSYDYDRLMILFNDFRNHITALAVQGMQWSAKRSDMTSVLYLANVYCGNKLQCLTLDHVTVDETLIDDFRDLFVDLRKFEDTNSLSPAAIARCLVSCRSLKHLAVVKSSITKWADYDASNMWITLQQNVKLTSLKLANVFIPTTEFLAFARDIAEICVDLSYVDSTAFKQIDWPKLLQLKTVRHLELPPTEYLSMAEWAKVAGRPSVNIETLALQVYHPREAKMILNTFTFSRLTTLAISFNYSGDETMDCLEDIDPPGSNDFFYENFENLVELHLLSFPTTFYTRDIVPCLEKMRSLEKLFLLSTDISLEHVNPLESTQSARKSILTVKYFNQLQMRKIWELFDRPNCVLFDCVDLRNYKFLTGKSKLYFQHLSQAPQ